MSMDTIIYNQIDFAIKAPRFKIVFSYMDDKNVSFVREYLLRLLKLTPCKPEQIAHYFGFSQTETEIALADLEYNNWITWQTDGLVSLSKEGEMLFVGSTDSPQIPTLKEFSGEYCMELLDNNFILKKNLQKYKQNSIELKVSPKNLADSKDIAQQVFQNRFKQLQEDDIIELKDKDVALYKIDAIETKGIPMYFRFTQNFELLPENGSLKERHDVHHVSNQENIQQSLTQYLQVSHSSNNLQEIFKSMSILDNEDIQSVFEMGIFDIAEYLKLWQIYDARNQWLFVGQSYHQEKSNKNELNKAFDEIEHIIKSFKHQSHEQKAKLYWLASNDMYWGKQRKIISKLEFLINNMNKGYDLRLYLPLPDERSKNSLNNWIYEFKDLPKNEILYGFNENFLSGNTEIMFLENKFALVCYHVKLASYPVSLPIGFMTTQQEEVEWIANFVSTYLATPRHEEKGFDFEDFGRLIKQ